MIKKEDLRRRREKDTRMRTIASAIGIGPSSSGSSVTAAAFEDAGVVVATLGALRPEDRADKIGVLNKLLAYSQTDAAKCRLLLDRGAKDLLVGWLAVQTGELETRDREDGDCVLTADAIELMWLLVRVIGKATWTPQAVFSSRYDKRLRELYKQLNSYMRFHSPEGASPGSEEASALHLPSVSKLIAHLKEIWDECRVLYRRGEEAHHQQQAAGATVHVKTERGL
jgi:hypothetical protein